MTWWQGLLVNTIVAVVAGGGFVGLITLRQQRRKLGADAAVGEATAAETLTGVALQMVQSAQRRAERAETKADKAETDALEAQRMATVAQQRLSRLVQWMRTQGIEPPDWVEQT